MLTQVSSFTNVDAAALQQLAEQGREEDLPIGCKLAEEGMSPEACYFLGSSETFLKRNGEGQLCTILTATNILLNITMYSSTQLSLGVSA